MGDKSFHFCEESEMEALRDKTPQVFQVKKGEEGGQARQSSSKQRDLDLRNCKGFPRMEPSVWDKDPPGTGLDCRKEPI